MMSTIKNRRKLKNYFLRKNIQIKLIIINLFHIFSVAAITLAIVLFPIISYMGSSHNLETRYQASVIFIDIAEKLPVALVLVACLVFIHQLSVTHHICGPLVNFNKTFKRIGQADLSQKVFLRKHDLLTQEADNINAMIDSLADRMSCLKNMHSQCMRKLNEINARSSEQSDTVYVADDIKRLQEYASNIDKEISSFIIGPKQT